MRVGEGSPEARDVSVDNFVGIVYHSWRRPKGMRGKKIGHDKGVTNFFVLKQWLATIRRDFLL
ncbi:hypothetical protein [Comamonas aquatica]|jgi:ABC-type nitrate/sulfonate/bicarbonate transport system substrate-binding protein|uniref:hypothetical protein n=2 Tax=Comamonas aquatica TaxID=225991 RepID=UPI001F1AC685|nr:hypothetical protein [Comamonas aquatica]